MKTVDLGAEYAGMTLCAVYDHEKNDYTFVSPERAELITKAALSLPDDEPLKRNAAMKLIGTMQEVTADDYGRVVILDVFGAR